MSDEEHDEKAAGAGPGEQDDEPGLGEEAAAVAESAAELGVGAIIAPFAGGQTVPMVETFFEMVEAGADRLSHLGHGAPSSEEERDGDAPDGDGGGEGAGTGAR